MKKAPLLLFLCSLFFTVILKSQSSFFKSYGKGPQDYAYGFTTTTEGGFAFTGTTNGYGGSNYLFIVKTLANGDTSWMRAYVTANTVHGWSIAQCADSGFVVCGNTGLARVDKNGNMLWTYVYNIAIFHAVTITTDGGFLFTGSVGSSGGSNGTDVYLLKTDVNGVKQWSKKMGGAQDDYATWVRESADGNYILCGSTASFGAGGWDTYVIKTNTLGDTLWTKVYGSSAADGGNSSVKQSIEQTIDKGFIIGSYSAGFASAGMTDAYVIKTDSLGGVQWSKTYGGAVNDVCSSIKPTTDGGYIFTGYTSSFGGGGTDIFVVKTDVNGDTLFTKAIGGLLNDYGTGITETPNGYVVSAYGNNFGNGNNDAHLLGFDLSGNTGCDFFPTGTMSNNAATQVSGTATGKIFITVNISSSSPVTKGGGGVVDVCAPIGMENFDAGRFKIYPNPSNGFFYVDLVNETTALITISDMCGRQVLKTHYRAGQALELNSLNGLYLLEIGCKGLITRHKLILCR